ncbi:MAG TPA: hypothetical protein VGQ08_18580 [Nitrospiraceae bacterium]|jgi:hypothetical protein|nr:hypothetical protein [Nitrospiraceae bacterium]
MQLEATGQPIRYRLKTGEEVTLRPGVPMELPDQAATRLLQKAPDKVRRVNDAAIPATCVTTLHAGSRITWEGADGNERRGTIDFLHCEADGTRWAFCTGLGGSWTAVNCKFVRAVQA